MQKIYPLQTAGGKGNMGMFIERDLNICAAGIPSSQSDQTVADCLRCYSLQDQVDCLIGDSIKPDPKALKLPPLRHPLPKDYRYSGPFSEAHDLIRPPIKTKFQALADDLKTTVYSSYWKNRTGGLPDQTPYLPEGFDYDTTLGKKTPYFEKLYDVIMPKDPVPDKTPIAKEPSYQINRDYCRPAFDPDLTYGRCMHAYHPGKWMKSCLTDERISLGIRNEPANKQQVDFLKTKRAPVGKVLAPYYNISNVPPDHSFGILKPPDNLPECLTHCRINPERQMLSECLRHLNTVRKCLKKRFDASFFPNFYLIIKYFDNSKSGWLPKQLIYNLCQQRYIVFNPTLIEPLLATFNAYDGEKIQYKTFVDIINHTIPTPELPKVWDIPEECIDYRTTYSEMVKPGQDPGRSAMAGLPSGRYLDLDYPVTSRRHCKADLTYLPHESDARACLSPSVLSLLGVSHRDMFTPRSPSSVRKVFEAVGDKLSDEEFQNVWNSAKNQHCEGFVCYETFRKALDEFNNTENKLG